jgi:urease accessory protein UreE
MLSLNTSMVVMRKSERQRRKERSEKMSEADIIAKLDNRSRVNGDCLSKRTGHHTAPVWHV